MKHLLSKYWKSQISFMLILLILELICIIGFGLYWGFIDSRVFIYSVFSIAIICYYAVCVSICILKVVWIDKTCISSEQIVNYKTDFSGMTKALIVTVVGSIILELLLALRQTQFDGFWASFYTVLSAYLIYKCILILRKLKSYSIDNKNDSSAIKKVYIDKHIYYEQVTCFEGSGAGMNPFLVISNEPFYPYTEQGSAFLFPICRSVDNNANQIMIPGDKDLINAINIEYSL